VISSYDFLYDLSSTGPGWHVTFDRAGKVTSFSAP
jgi:hypothetical protein